MVLSSFVRFPILLVLATALLLIGSCRKTNADDPSLSPPSTNPAPKLVIQPFRPDLQDWPHNVSDVAPDPRVKYGRLENGLRYAVLPVEDKRGRISVQLNMDVGFNQEPEHLYGIAHLLEHIAFRGKRGDKDDSLIHNLQAGGVGFGSDLNGFTSFDLTNYRINIVSSGKTTVNDALRSLKTIADLPELTQENMEAEKRIVLAELKTRNSVKARADRAHSVFRTPNNPRIAVDGAGTQDSLAAITLQDLEQFKTDYYVPENAFLVIAGDVNVERTKRHIKDIFAIWPAAPSKQYDSAIEEVGGPVEDVVTFQDPEASRYLVALQHRPASQLVESLASRKQNFVRAIANSVMKSRIDQRVEPDSQIDWMSLIRSRSKTQALFGVKIVAHDHPLAMTVFEEERRKAVEFGFTADEIDYAIAKWRAPFLNSRFSSDKISAWSEARKISDRFSDGFVYNSSSQELAILDEIIEELSLEDYHLAAQDMWSGFEPKYWMQSNQPMSGTIKAVKAARIDVAERVLKSPEGHSNKHFQKAELGAPGEIKSRDIDKVNKTQRLLFENGVRLNYKVNEADPDEIVIVLALRELGGEMVDKNYAAIAEKVGSLSRADIKDADAASMDRQFVGTKTDFTVFLNMDRLALSLVTNRESLQAGLDLMSTFLVSFDPLSKDYQKRFEDNLRNVKNASQRSPNIEGSLKIGFAYSGGSEAYRSRFAKSFVIDSKINAHIDRILKSATIEVGVVGDFDAQTLEAAFASSLGALPARPEVTKKAVKTNDAVSLIEPGLSTLTYKGSADQMSLFYCHPNSDRTLFAGFSEANLLSTIAENRLLENLRIEKGISYSPQVLLHKKPVFPKFGFACLYAQFDPANEMPAHDIFRNVISSFQDTPITKSELNRAREPLLSSAQRHDESNFSDSVFVASSYSNPDLSKNYGDALKALKAMSLKTLNARARELYDLSDFHIFRVQHYQGERAIRTKNWEVESHFGNMTGQFEMGKFLLRSGEKADIDRGIKLLNAAGAQGLKEAYYEVGNYYAVRSGQYKKENQKAIANAFELSGPSDKAAYRLASLYFLNYNNFPDVEDAHIIKLARQSAESGDARGQEFLAERLTDGTMVERDLIGALKWALISNHSRRGVLSVEDERSIARFVTGLPEADVQTAQAQAEAWVAQNENQKRE